MKASDIAYLISIIPDNEKPEVKKELQKIYLVAQEGSFENEFHVPVMAELSVVVS